MPFFHKIRKNLIPGEGVKGFLLYAISEILQVMIGILIALKVSNRNDERKERETEKSILASILKSLVADSSDIQFNIDAHKVRLNSQKLVFLKITSGIVDS